MGFQMLTGDTLAFSYSSWVILLKNSLAHERQINLSVVAVGRSRARRFRSRQLWQATGQHDNRPSAYRSPSARGGVTANEGIPRAEIPVRRQPRLGTNRKPKPLEGMARGYAPLL